MLRLRFINVCLRYGKVNITCQSIPNTKPLLVVTCRSGPKPVFKSIQDEYDILPVFSIIFNIRYRYRYYNAKLIKCHPRFCEIQYFCLKDSAPKKKKISRTQRRIYKKIFLVSGILMRPLSPIFLASIYILQSRPNIDDIDV